ncbi:stage V sporulation protein D [Schinkia azotoformans MEV2011]|uniref:serine-type D-Ala-D-Ala carboxypeptidase n=1 Tax=Schinkia azotoformans MEV2011 TaxID=1348973 RepID=A0A072NLU3_SCHAZ|nr:stage V sporulation protein D [Schinkia azotoformans]KEF38609.1 stage V sporulation protein D [Schinkia azotoformans MEV2011]MEC1698076.1 stage V sporulation protein D [Schinkia azotoformans]MEC1727520.1 stage V sporulation protein D [Schinkia azotoformans]MEC1773054.1 stage V sporulation protein D [Schinkia azotoformans]MEC1779272.1 stage V sporulation protein D [Schinkia azotoformans]
MRVSNVTVRKRLVTVLLIGLLLFLVIDVRLGYVQLVMGNWLSDKAMDSWGRDIPFEPERGEILDRNGVPLATNVSAPTVYVIPRQIGDPADAAKKLAAVLNASEEKVYKSMTKNSLNERITEGRKLSNEKANEVRALNLKGVYIAEDSKRHYPFGSYLSHVLGFTGIDNQGLMGLELYYDEKLSGKRGHISYIADAKGRKMPNSTDEYTPPIDGLNMKLTIDSRVQTIIERELDIAEATYNPDGAIALAMDPKTGEILGMSSRPDFDPEKYQTVPQEVYNRNLPVWSTYEPGSTFKIITLAAALEEKLVDLEKDHFNDPGAIRVEGATLRCWRRGGHGSQTFLEVVQNSCNPGFVTLGQKLGKDRLFQYIKNFGFGQKTGIDLQGEGTGILFKMDRVGPVELATTAFGQGVSVTPIQQVTAVAAAVNGGFLYQPYIAKEWVDPITGKVISRNTPIMKKRVISEETSKQVRYALESVVAQGTGKGAFVDGYRVGGKTGTAQKVKDGRYMENNHIVSFIGFAPADDPQVVVYTAIDNPKGTVQFGGVVAAPIVGNILEDSLRALDVKKRSGQIEKEYTYPDPRMVEVPNIVGLKTNELQKYLIDLRLEKSGVGSIVIDQTPEPGEKVESGATIRILLGGE